MENLGDIIAIAVTFALTFVLPYVIKARAVLKEGAEVLVKIDEALEDNKVTAEEIVSIKKESRDVWVAIQAFGKK